MIESPVFFPKAVLFDFDGVLVDTEWAIYQSWERVFRAHGHALPLDCFNQCLGSGYTHWNPADHLESLTGKTYDWETINAERQERIHADLAHSGLMSGALELLNWCRKQALPLAVASSSSHRWVDGWLEKLGIRDRFVSVLCRDDGLPVKPDPALYVESARRLSLPPADCLVIEDSENGTTAAHRAGIPVIAVPNRITECANFELATCRVSSLHKVLELLQHSPLAR